MVRYFIVGADWRTVAITTFSVMWFGETLSPMKIGGLVLLITGIGLIKSGTKKATVRQSAQKVKQVTQNAVNAAKTNALVGREAKSEA